MLNGASIARLVKLLSLFESIVAVQYTLDIIFIISTVHVTLNNKLVVVCYSPPFLAVLPARCGSGAVCTVREGI